MQHRIHKQPHIPRQRQPELEALPEPLDETELIALAMLALEHIEIEIDGKEPGS